MNRAAPPTPDDRSPAAEWLARHKGSIALAGAIGLLVAGFVWKVPWLLAGAEAAVVGGLCDWVALVMLFERVPLLPGFGIVPRNHERIVAGISRAVGEEWLSDRAIAEQIERLDLAPALRHGVEEYATREDVVRTVLSFVARRFADWVESEAFHALVTERVRTVGGRVGDVAHAIGIFDYEEMAARVSREIRASVREAAENPEVIQQIAEEGRDLGRRLEVDPHWAQNIDRAKHEVAEIAAPVIRQRVARAVGRRLSDLSPEEMKEMLKEKAGPSLEWIRVNGAVLGFGVGLGFHWLLG